MIKLQKEEKQKLLNELQDLLKWYRTMYMLNIVTESDEEYLEVRLRCYKGNWHILYGDSSFDTDHRGMWGFGCLLIDMTEEDLEYLLDDLVNQIEDAPYSIV